jgi:HEAT repeat protein
MKARGIAFLVGWAVLQFAGVLCGDEVEVVAPKAQVKIGERVIAEVDAGRRLRLLKTQGPWVAVIVGEGERAERGWVLANKVRRVVDPHLENAPAPEAPVDFRLEADWTQVRPAPDGKTHYLFLLAKLTNETLERAKFSVGDLRLLVDNEPMEAVWPSADVAIDPRDERRAGFGGKRAFPRGGGRFPGGFGGAPGFRNFGGPPAPQPGAERPDPRPGRRVPPSIQLPSPILPPGEQPFHASNFLVDVELAPGARVEGWLCFDLSPLAEAIKEPFELAEKSWLLEAKFGEQNVTLDLKAHEIEKLGAVLRPSKYDARVRVMEISPHVNALNAGKLIDMLDAVSQNETRHLLVFRAAKWHLEDFSADQLARWQPDRSYLSVRVLPPESFLGGSSFRLRLQRDAVSEEAGTVQILGYREGTGADLVKYLAAQAAETRVAAARALSSHLAEAGVIHALAKAATDSEPLVRAASASALGNRNRSKLTRSPNDESAVTEIFLKAMRDPNPSVRNAAALAAGSARSEAIEQELIARLSDEVHEVRTNACLSLGELKCRAAIGKLKELQAGNDKRLAASAIHALQRIGELTELEAAVARLDCGQPESMDFDKIVKANERRAIPKLIAMLKSNETGFNNYAARALGEMKAQEAFEPLLETFAVGPESAPFGGRRGIRSSEYVVALGKLGDPRAIAPIRAVMREETSDPFRRLACYEALLLLKAADAYDDLLAELKQTEEVNETTLILRLLATYGGEKAIATIEPYLDREANCRFAAIALTLIPSPLAAKGMESRLRSADYRFGPQVLYAVSSNRQWFESEVGKTLLRKAAASENEVTRAAAAKLSKSPEEEPDPTNPAA